jgi:hypothetical protein
VILRLFSSPWAEFAGEDGIALEGRPWTQPHGAVHARLVGELPNHGSWNGSRPVLAANADSPHYYHWDIPFPVRGDQAGCFWVTDSETVRGEFEGLPPRAPDVARGESPREQWLVWQLQRYAELAELDEHKNGNPLEARLAWGARRTWDSVAKYWRMGSDEAAELALIVRLAQDTRLVRALRSIERGPRRMLLRKHELVKVSRIQEMDSGTLRVYSQAPGRSAVQKAGAKQELLAVVRQDTVDLVENRVLLWVAGRATRMAAIYCQRNARFHSTVRFQLVQQLQRLCQLLLNSQRLEDVGSLPHHLSAPTYCLQFERRYRRIWHAYCMIRRQDRLEDDAWQWQTHFWGTSARLLVGSMLLELRGWAETRVSTPYFRGEGSCGEWLEGPSTPGPYSTPYGTCHVLDLRDGIGFIGGPGSQLPEVATRSGADWILVWPERRRLLLLWSAVAAGVRAIDNGSLGMVRLSTRIARLSLESNWSWGALLFVAVPEAEADLDTAPNIVAVRVPVDVHTQWDNVRAALEVAMEELHRG